MSNVRLVLSILRVFMTKTAQAYKPVHEKEYLLEIILALVHVYSELQVLQNRSDILESNYPFPFCDLKAFLHN